MKKIILLTISILISNFSWGQEKNISEGPFNQLIIRGVTLINGNGSPPRGPVDIVVENDKIVSIRSVGYPGVEINERRRPKLNSNGREIDANGMYIIPGFIDMHGHIGGGAQGAPGGRPGPEAAAQGGNARGRQGRWRGNLPLPGSRPGGPPREGPDRNTHAWHAA